MKLLHTFNEHCESSRPMLDVTRAGRAMVGVKGGSIVAPAFVESCG